MQLVLYVFVFRENETCDIEDMLPARPIHVSTLRGQTSKNQDFCYLLVHKFTYTRSSYNSYISDLCFI